MNFQAIWDTELDDRIKGIPGGVPPFRLGNIAKQRWNVLRQDLPLPLAVLRRSALEHNRRAFREYITTRGLSFAPHGKTTLAPQLFQQQLDDGAWAITAATVSHVQVYRKFGVSRVLFANQLVGRQNVRYVLDELKRDPQFEFYCLVDSIDLVRQLADAVRAAQLNRPLRVLLEGGMEGGRTGCRTLAQAEAVLAAIDKTHGALTLAGVEGFEGIAGGPSPEATTKVEQYLSFLRELLLLCQSNDPEFLLTAGGSCYFDRVAEVFREMPGRIVVRSGCYLTHDSGMLESFQRQRRDTLLQPALEVWSYVQSLPEPDLALLTMGRRDCSFDAGLPVPQKLYRPGQGWLPVGDAQVTALNDHHAYLRCAGLELRIGDMLASGISHPCTTFDKWKFLPVVDDDYTVVDGVLTFF